MPSHRVRVFLASFMLACVLQAHSAGSGQLTATWTDNSGGVAATIIERRLSEEPTYNAIGDLAPGIATYVDPAIADGLTYCYRVKAYDGVGESPYSEEVCAASMPAPEPIPVPAPSPSPYNIAVLKSGSGAGTVTSSPAGIVCGTDCDEAYGTGTLVTLTATAASGSRFTGWSGGCSGTSLCTISGNSEVLVTATFEVFTPPGHAKRGGGKR
jgi:hypothetical protein